MASRVYVGNWSPNNVSVIDTATNTVTDTIPVGVASSSGPIGVAVTPDGSKVYVANVWLKGRLGNRHVVQHGG